jgi:hypothetical protein
MVNVTNLLVRIDVNPDLHASLFSFGLIEKSFLQPLQRKRGAPFGRRAS